jgi:hypothetical protein
MGYVKLHMRFAERFSPRMSGAIQGCSASAKTFCADWESLERECLEDASEFSDGAGADDDGGVGGLVAERLVSRCSMFVANAPIRVEVKFIHMPEIGKLTATSS